MERSGKITRSHGYGVQLGYRTVVVVVVVVVEGKGKGNKSG